MEQSYTLIKTTFLKLSLKIWVTGISTLCLIFGLIFFLRECTGHTIPHKGLYVIARDVYWPTIDVYGKEKSIVAFTNELMNAISNIVHVQFRWLDLSRGDLMHNLNDGYADALIMGTTPNPFAEDTLIFSDTLLATGPVLLVRQNSPINSLKEFSGKSVGMIWSLFTAYNAELQVVINDYHLVRVDYNTSLQALEALVKDQIDGVFLDTNPAYILQDTLYNGLVKIITSPVTNQGLHFIVLKDSSNEKFMEEFDAAFETLKKDGTYDNLITKWNLIDPDRRFVQSQNQHSSEK